ncbi:J domain-containing protein [Pseudomonas sp. RIT-PI-S]|uniref:J domain-containing protein n=1 Tax=Pseudomonas sp. RIT-PI-S TaxID=3035295 RepID=UPI0021DA3E77|nr:J domain-containing protein [Pseudomonas sp. RIT-PI-S]
MNHWHVLGLTPEADERSIKRAYARLLKSHRPDEDPEGFQRLREAYDASLVEARWRAEEGERASDALLFVSLLAPDESPLAAPVVVATAQAVAPASRLASQAPPASVEILAAPEHHEALATIDPPQPAFWQMQQWLAEGKDRQVLDALRVWLASDWLLPFERRQQFEQDVLGWLESAPQWSPAFFDAVCQAIGWDETRGDLPCEHWRWNALIRRCEAQAQADTVRAELAAFEADRSRGWGAALLLKPMADRKRRQLADNLISNDWQRFAELAQTIEYQYPELPRLVGAEPLSNWRDWLPATSYRGVYLFLWLALFLVLIASAMLGGQKHDALGALVMAPLMVIVLIWIGMKAYHVWAMVAVTAAQLDVVLSRPLLPRRLYRDGAGLLLLRHILPSAVPAFVAYAWSGPALWLRCASPALVMLGTLYFTHLALRGGKVSFGVRVSRLLKAQLGRLPWHLLANEGLLAVIAVAVTGTSIYLHMKGSV